MKNNQVKLLEIKILVIEINSLPGLNSEFITTEKRIGELEETSEKIIQDAFQKGKKWKI